MHMDTTKEITMHLINKKDQPADMFTKAINMEYNGNLLFPNLIDER